MSSNVLAGRDPNTIVKKVCFMLNKKKHWKNPFGDGKAGTRIVQILEEGAQTSFLQQQDALNRHRARGA